MMIIQWMLKLTSRRARMGMLRSCCLCFSTRTGSFVLGTVSGGRGWWVGGPGGGNGEVPCKRWELLCRGGGDGSIRAVKLVDVLMFPEWTEGKG